MVVVVAAVAEEEQPEPPLIPAIWAFLDLNLEKY